MAESDVVIHVRVALENATKQLNKMKTHIASLKKPVAATFKNLDIAINNVEKSQRRLNKITGAAGKQFAGWALSLMFFGQAIKQIFNRIWRDSTKVFNEVMHSVENTVTGFDLMNGSLTYLKYLAGEALEPIATWLVPIIDAVADWIEQNQGLFRTIVLVMGVLGTAFAVGGAATLAINGFSQLAGIIRTMPVLGALLTPAGLVAVGALTALGAISWKAFSETPEAWEAVKDTFNSSLGPVITKLKDEVVELFNIMTGGFIESWQDLGFMIGWAFSTGIKAIKPFFETMSAVVNILSGAILAVQAFWAAVTFDLDTTAVKMVEATRQFVQAGKDFQSSYASSKELFNDFETPEEFKRRALGKDYYLAELMKNMNQNSTNMSVETINFNVSRETDVEELLRKVAALR